MNKPPGGVGGDDVEGQLKPYQHDRLETRRERDWALGPRGQVIVPQHLYFLIGVAAAATALGRLAAAGLKPA